MIKLYCYLKRKNNRFLSGIIAEFCENHKKRELIFDEYYFTKRTTNNRAKLNVVLTALSGVYSRIGKLPDQDINLRVNFTDLDKIFDLKKDILHTANLDIIGKIVNILDNYGELTLNYDYSEKMKLIKQRIDLLKLQTNETNIFLMMDQFYEDYKDKKVNVEFEIK